MKDPRFDLTRVSTSGALILCVGLSLLDPNAALSTSIAIPSDSTFTIESGSNGSGFGALYRSTVHAEAGDVHDVDRRGFAQFDITGRESARVVLLEFTRQSITSGIDFELTLDTYVGWISTSRNIYSAPSTGQISTFFRDAVGDGATLSIDITDAFNSAILAGDSLLGVRIRKSMELTQSPQSVTYVNFNLQIIPEPSTAFLFGLGLIGLSAMRRSAPRT